MVICCPLPDWAGCWAEVWAGCWAEVWAAGLTGPLGASSACLEGALECLWGVVEGWCFFFFFFLKLLMSSEASCSALIGPAHSDTPHHTLNNNKYDTVVVRLKFALNNCFEPGWHNNRFLGCGKLPAGTYINYCNLQPKKLISLVKRAKMGSAGTQNDSKATHLLHSQGCPPPPPVALPEPSCPAAGRT